MVYNPLGREKIHETLKKQMRGEALPPTECQLTNTDGMMGTGNHYPEGSCHPKGSHQ